MAAMAWEIPPDTSHLYGWFFEDTAAVDQRIALSSRGQLSQLTRAILTVGFVRSPADKSLGRTYEYYFTNDDEGRDWLEKLRAAGQPGKVIWAMRKANVKYREV